ncbi:MAG: DUF5716 family protein [Lachnospiraceae bacterium]|nr:DUF5716 family protein [Lachnospiraceae bacterium]
MPLINEIPDSFWSLFRSYNREIYIEALLKINEEYQYNNYFLSREVCIQVLGNSFSGRGILKEEQETDADVLEPPATRILNWLVRTRWLKRLEDYSTGVTNIVIPDYSAVFIEAFERLCGEDQEETEVYIQNIYAILFSYKADPVKNEKMLKTALINTKKLNKALQDMLHNMDKFFTSLLEKRFYGDLLKEHLDGYVEEIVRKKYHILKTSDNFYLYKTDIRLLLGEIRERHEKEWEEDEIKTETDKEALSAQQRLELQAKSQMEEQNREETLDIVNQIERGFQDIEHRIANMDREHTRYVRATVTRLNYLLNEDEDMRGMIVQLLRGIATGGQERVDLVAKRLNFSHVDVLSEKSLYKRKKGRRSFTENLEADEEPEELSREDVLKMNRMNSRFSRRQIEQFIEEHMDAGKAVVAEGFVHSDEEFEKLILAYDYATRKGSKYQITEESGEMVEDGRYRYPALTFRRRPQK